MPQILAAALCLILALATPAQAQLPLQPSAGAEQSEGETEGGELRTLIEILEDEAARQRLIETLRQAAEGEAASQEEEAPATTLAGRLAEYTTDVAESTADVFDVVGVVVRSVGALLSSTAGADMRAIGLVVFNVGIVLIGVFGVFALVRLLARRLHQSFSATAGRSGVVRRASLIVASVVVDGVTVLVAWGVGYVIALNVGQTWRMGVNQTLFLNAFLLVELAKVLARAGFGPNWPSLRPLPLDDTTAAYWYFWLSRVLSLLGYTFLFVAPLSARYLSPDAADAVRVLVGLAALVMAVLIILQNRDNVRARFLRWAGTDDVIGNLLTLLAGVWHILAIVYLVAVFALWLLQQGQALPFVLWATVRSLIAVALAGMLLALAGRLARRGIPIPAEMRERLPLLQLRLNAFVPNMLRVVRILVLIAVVIALAQIWQLVDFLGWLSSEIGQRVAGSLISATLILIVGALLYLAVSSWVEYRLNPNVGHVPSSRERTLLSLFRNAVTIALAIIVVMLALAELGVNIGPLIAGAGVVGLAIGFGAQKLVQDVITGVFIQFENAMNEGDVVQLAGIAGVVEKLTVRSVSLRGLDGTLHLIPFSSVDTVANYVKYFSYHLAEIRVAYRERIPEVKDAMLEAFERLRQTEFNDHILDELEMHGVTGFGDSAVTVRARIKTVAGEQWGVGRAYNEILKEVFDARGIEIPYPHVTLYLGQDKQGHAPPLHVDMLSKDGTSRSSATATKEPKASRRRVRRRAAKGPTQDAPNDDEG